VDDIRRLGPPLCRTRHKAKKPDRLGAMVSGDVQSQRFRCPRSFGEDQLFLLIAQTADSPAKLVERSAAHKVHAVVRMLVAQPVTKYLILVPRSKAVCGRDSSTRHFGRAFAPACPGSKPGGLLPYELVRAARCCGASPKVVAVDIVEVDPEKDIADNTAMAAASCFLAFAEGLRSRIKNASSLHHS
jgi:Arginase family